MRFYFPWIVLAVAVVSPASSYAYDDDTHYDLTYYLARKLGYTQRQAQQIASADVSIDYDPVTEPIQKAATMDPARDAQGPRVRFHAFRDSRLMTKIIEAEQLQGKPFPVARSIAVNYAETAKRRQLELLLGRVVPTGNPGAYLHAFQDVGPHSGYESFAGHVAAAHSPDYLSTDVSKTVTMAEGTIDVLRRFMRQYLGREAPAVDMTDVRRVLQELIAVNPVAEHGDRSPDEARARGVVARFLGEAVPDKILYRFTPDGEPLDPGSYALSKDGDTPSIADVPVRVFAWGHDDSDNSDVAWDAYYPNPSLNDDPNRHGSPNARWRGQHWWQGDQLCLAVHALEAPFPPGHTLSLGYRVQLGGATFEDGTSDKIFVLSRFAGQPAERDVQACHRVKRADAAPPTATGGSYNVYLLTNAGSGLFVGTEAQLRGRTRCEFEGGGNGCSAADQVSWRVLAGSYSTYDEARVALCANTTERRYFPLGIGLKGRWRGGEWYGLWHDTVTGPCLGATTAAPVAESLPPPKTGFAIFQLTNASNGLFLGTEEALRARTRCSFEGGGTNCTARDVATYRILAGPFPTEQQARAVLCASITERREFPLGVGLKGRWQASNTWYGLWDGSVTRDCR